MLAKEVIELLVKYDIDPNTVERAYYAVESAPKHRIYFTGADPDIEVRISVTIDGSRYLRIYDYREKEVPDVGELYLTESDGMIHTTESIIPDGLTVREAVEWASEYRKNHSK